MEWYYMTLVSTLLHGWYTYTTLDVIVKVTHNKLDGMNILIG